ncbi:MAG: transcription antitermination factor NusB [Pseudomonadota bacterium]|nr:transcription antitermination factor NusB [Pseudomonadota bacterium]
MSEARLNPSLQKKAAARMAAAQCLYTAAVNKEALAPTQRINALKARLADNRDEQKLTVGQPVEPNYKLAEALLAGVADRQVEIDALLDSALKVGWTRARMSPLMVAILQCAIFELRFGKEISPKIVIDEYTRLTRSFFADDEVNFVHGCLSQLAHG